MKKVILIVSILFSFFLNSCTLKELLSETLVPEGDLVTVDKEIEDFTSIEVSSGISVTLLDVLDDNKISISTNENIQDFIQISLSNKKLYIQIKNGYKLDDDATVNIILSYNKIDSIDSFITRNASYINCASLDKVKELNVRLYDESKIFLGLSSEKTYLEAEGKSEFYGPGRYDDLDAELSGSCEVNINDKGIGDLKITMKDSSFMICYVSNSIDIIMSGWSRFIYKGTTNFINQQITGNASIIS
ncbi:MAG: DUF2807 domain-containing protein [Bacteroidales bacterium]